MSPEPYQQFYLQSLAHACCLVGDEMTGQALVFGPRTDVDVYTDAARVNGFAHRLRGRLARPQRLLSGLTKLTERSSGLPPGSCWAHRLSAAAVVVGRRHDRVAHRCQTHRGDPQITVHELNEELARGEVEL